jgi:hypothetical protein
MPTGTKESSGQNSRDDVPPLLLLVFSGASDVEPLNHVSQESSLPNVTFSTLKKKDSARNQHEAKTRHES